MRRYELGLYEKALPDSLLWSERLEICRSCGFDRLELSIDETDRRMARLFDAPFLRELTAAIRSTGVPIKTLCLSAHRKYPFGSHDPKLRARSLELMDAALDFAGEIGVELIQLAGYDVYYEEHDDYTQNMFRENLQQAVELAEKTAVRLGFETMETPFMDTVAKAMTYVSQINSPHLAVYPDIGNLQNAAVLYGHDIAADLRCGEGHIVAAHLKETRPGIYRNMLPGHGGHTDYDTCIRELWRQGIRSFTGELWYQEGSDYRRILCETAAFLRSKIELSAAQQ